MDDCKVFIMGDSHLCGTLSDYGNGIDRNDIVINSGFNSLSQSLNQSTKNKCVYYFMCSGASACGFIPEHNSVTNAFNLSCYYSKSLKPDTKLVFKFGQVDMDVIYPYKCINNNEKIELDTFVNNTIERYMKGINEIKNFNNNVYVIGINPPSTRTVKTILSNMGSGDKFDYYNILPYDFLLEKRTTDLRLFNTKLKLCCEQNNIVYMDFWDELIDNNNSILKIQYYHPLVDDHHIYVQNDKVWYEYFWNKLQNVLNL